MFIKVEEEKPHFGYGGTDFFLSKWQVRCNLQNVRVTAVQHTLLLSEVMVITVY
jgi:hypothetical protein